MIVVVNKMDSCEWSKVRFDEITKVMSTFLIGTAGFQKHNLTFIPVSGLSGENLKESKEAKLKMWYTGPTLVQTIDALTPCARPLEKALRFCVADVRKGLTVGGKVEAGFVRTKDELYVFPQGKSRQMCAVYVPHFILCTGEKCRVKSILKTGGSNSPSATAGENVELVLNGIEPNILQVGSILCPLDSPVPVTNCFEAKIITLSALQVPILRGTQFTLYTQSVQVPATVSSIISITVESEGKSQETMNPRFVRKNQVARVEITTDAPVCVERYEDYRPLSRVLLRTDGLTVAAGVVNSIIKR